MLANFLRQVRLRTKVYPKDTKNSSISISVSGGSVDRLQYGGKSRHTLADRLRNICFVLGLCSDRIQTIVCSRNNDNFDEIVETA